MAAEEGTEEGKRRGNAIRKGGGDRRLVRVMVRMAVLERRGRSG